MCRYSTRSRAQTITNPLTSDPGSMMNYNLNKLSKKHKKPSPWAALRKLLQLIEHERKTLWMALAAILSNSALNLFGPLIIGITIDKYILANKNHWANYHGVLANGGILLAMYLGALVS